MEYTVRRELVTACRLAGSPTRRSPLSVKATMLGVSRMPSWLAMTFTSPPSMTATTELVVPRSMPMIFSSAMEFSFQAKSVPGAVLYGLRAVYFDFFNNQLHLPSKNCAVIRPSGNTTVNYLSPLIYAQRNQSIRADGLPK